MNPPLSLLRIITIFIIVGQSHLMPATSQQRKNIKMLSTLAPDQFVLPGEDTQPNKCFKKSFREPILIDGCNPVFFDNNYCLGSCNSFFVPSYKDNLQLCKACIPVKYKKVDVTFTCMRNGKELKEIKTLNVIEDCQCQDVSCTKKK